MEVAGATVSVDFENRLDFEKGLNKLEQYCIALSVMTELSEKFIKALNELASLRTVRQQLTRQNSITSNDRYAAVMEDNVPDELKCPVCFEIFEEEVIQCRNGHSLCSQCCKALRMCPECREEYTGKNGGGRVRNRTVEKLVLTLKIECPYNSSGCREKMICKEMHEHVEMCQFMNKPVRSPEYLSVKKKVKQASGVVKRMERQLKETNKRLMDCKTDWVKSRERNPNSASLQEAALAFLLEEKELKMMAMYVKVTQLLQS